MTKIYVDADACPVIRVVEKVAEENKIPVCLLCDTNHNLWSKYSEIKVIEAGDDTVDFALIGLVKAGDVVVTQDYGVAAMALAKGAYGIHQSGRWYTNDNIDQLLMERHIAKTARIGKGRMRLRGQAKRTAQDNKKFEDSFRKLLKYVIEQSGSH